MPTGIFRFVASVWENLRTRTLHKMNLKTDASIFTISHEPTIFALWLLPEGGDEEDNVIDEGVAMHINKRSAQTSTIVVDRQSRHCIGGEQCLIPRHVEPDGPILIEGIRDVLKIKYSLNSF